jgi:hypothetical protein
MTGIVGKVDCSYQFLLCLVKNTMDYFTQSPVTVSLSYF